MKNYLVNQVVIRAATRADAQARYQLLDPGSRFMAKEDGDIAHAVITAAATHLNRRRVTDALGDAASMRQLAAVLRMSARCLDALADGPLDVVTELLGEVA